MGLNIDKDVILDCIKHNKDILVTINVSDIMYNTWTRAELNLIETKVNEFTQQYITFFESNFQRRQKTILFFHGISLLNAIYLKNNTLT